MRRCNLWIVMGEGEAVTIVGVSPPTHANRRDQARFLQALNGAPDGSAIATGQLGNRIKGRPCLAALPAHVPHKR